MENNAVPISKPDANDETRCDLCGQYTETVRPRTMVTMGLQSAIVRTKFCNQCAATVEKWNNCAPAGGASPFGERTLVTLLDRPLTPAEGEDVTRHLVENAVERDLPSLLEKYRAAEKRSGGRVQVCITDYDETTYNFLHIGTGWTHGFWRMVNHATARRLRHEGFAVRFVSLDLDDYMAWLARKNLRDASTAREQFAAAIADWEMGIKSAVPALGSELSGETSKRQACAYAGHSEA